MLNRSETWEAGERHTNTIEGFWSFVKQAWYGSHDFTTQCLAQRAQRLQGLKFESVGNLSHGISVIRLYPLPSKRRPARYREVTLGMLISNGWFNYTTTLHQSQIFFFHTTIGGVYIPALKDGGLTPKILINNPGV